MAKGSTASRMKLYQIGIAEFWEDVQEVFKVKVYDREYHIKSFHQFLGSC